MANLHLCLQINMRALYTFNYLHYTFILYMWNDRLKRPLDKRS